MRTRRDFLRTSAALAAGGLLSSCDLFGMGEGAAPSALAGPRALSSLAWEGIWGTGNVNFQESYLSAKIAIAHSLGVTALRVNQRGPEALTGSTQKLNAAKAIINACYNTTPRLSVLLSLTGDPTLLTDDTQLENGGAAWGSMLSTMGSGSIVIGFSIQNESDNDIKLVYEDEGGLPNPEPGDTSNAADEARARAAEHARVVRAFCSGLRQTLWGGVCIPGGMAQPESTFAKWALEAMADDINDGDLLDGVAVHWYKNRSEFTQIPSPGTEPVFELNGDSLEQRVDNLLSYCMIDYNRPGFGVYVPECNIDRVSFGQNLGSSTNVAKAKAGLRALLDEICGDPRVKLIFPFSPWFELPNECTKSKQYLINCHDEHAVTGQPTPAWLAVVEYTGGSPMVCPASGIPPACS